MYDLLLICTYRHLFPLLDSLREYCQQTRSTVGASIVDMGISEKLAQGCLLLSFPHQVDPACIQRLEADSRVIDYYLLMDEQAGREQADTLPLALLPAPERIPV